MSVAFRRDSDEVHLEPKFEIPIPPGPNLVTERGLAQIEAKVIALEAELRVVADESIIAARKRELRYWRKRRSTAQVVAEADGERVSFGSAVVLEVNGKQRSMMIVGDDEADPAAGLLSFSAPLCRAIMDAEAGDLIDFGGKQEAIAILSIKPVPR